MSICERVLTIRVAGYVPSFTFNTRLRQAVLRYSKYALLKKWGEINGWQCRRFERCILPGMIDTPSCRYFPPLPRPDGCTDVIITRGPNWRSERYLYENVKAAPYMHHAVYQLHIFHSEAR